VHDDVIAWYRRGKRDLPWRDGRTDAYGVLVSEVMLQQTQVERVIPIWQQWLTQWPTPSALAAADLGAVLVTWGRLGYPRRAARLQQACRIIAERHDDEVPDDYEALIALPGIGDYTACAVLAFAHGRRVPVIDTNVRRVWGRYSAQWRGDDAATTKTQRRFVESALPGDGSAAAEFSVAVMEIGALICSAKAEPACVACPLRPGCAWRAGERPAPQNPARRQPKYQGSLRQTRGHILATLRECHPFEVSLAELSWPDSAQLARALDSLAEDGLVRVSDESVALPS